MSSDPSLNYNPKGKNGLNEIRFMPERKKDKSPTAKINLEMIFKRKCGINEEIIF